MNILFEVLDPAGGIVIGAGFKRVLEIGRASCRERV
jgi:hypothetical protein